MTTYAPQALDSSGAALTFNNAAAGDRVPPGCTLIVKNTSGSAVTPTLVTPLTLDGNALADKTCTNVAATTGLNAIPVPTSEVYRDPSDGMVAINWSATSGVSFAVIP